MRYLSAVCLVGIFVVTLSMTRDSFSNDLGEQLTDLEPIPSLIQSVRFPAHLEFCDIRVPLEDPVVRADLEKEMLLILWNRPQVILWIKRAAQLFPHVEQILAEEQMPDDLKYVPVIESSLLPHARSVANAVGYWQFLESTGRRYGLRIDNDVDERRNIFKSTRAACRYLKKLTTEFGSISLALAAYNMGEHGLAVEIDAQQTHDYFDLYLPLETQRYLHKIIAAKLILEQPEIYGFYLNSEDMYPALNTATLDISLEKEVPILIMAKAADISFKTFKIQNPDIRGYYLSPGSVSFQVPADKTPGFHDRFSALYADWQKKSPVRIHVVAAGESLIGIARSYQMSLAELLRLNDISYKKVIHPGDRLKVK
ncbi:MAG: transglycosylase SLT domain-containing protein [Desulfotignum sp.]